MLPIRFFYFIGVYMKQPVLLGALLLGAASAQAQTNFRPGYVVTLAGDTLKGEVDSRGAQRNARLSRFRTSKAAPITEYRPQQLRGYGFTGDRVYQTETVLLSDSLSRNAIYKLKIDTLQRPSFLEALVLGPASLLFLRDEHNKDHYYLRMAGKPVQELIQNTHEVVENSVTYRGKTHEYRRTLAAATQQCPAIQSAITTVRFGQNGLADLVQRYNDCVGATSITPAAESRRSHVQLSLVVGAEKNRLTLYDPHPAQEIQATSSVRPTAGLGLTLHPPGITRAISARVEALYEKQTYSLATGVVNLAGLMYEYRVDLESVRFPLLLRYTYPKGAVRPFGYAGYSFSYFLNNRNEVRNTNAYDGSDGTLSIYNWRPWLKSPRRLEQGLVGGVGLTTARTTGRNVALELRYESSDGFSNVGGQSSRLNRVYLLLSYDLTK